MNFFIKFVPFTQNKAVYRLPIRAVDRFQAEMMLYELATILDAEKSDSYVGETVYVKSLPDPEGQLDLDLYSFQVVEE